MAAQEPGQQHYMLLQRVDQPHGRTLEEIALRSMSERAASSGSTGSATSLNGLDAYVGVYQGELSGVGRVMMRAAHIVGTAGRSTCSPASRREPSSPTSTARSTAPIQSFRPLTQREADDIRPNRLDFYTRARRRHWQSIAARGGGLVRATELAIMNNHAVNDQPKPGERIKIVVEG